MGFRFDVVPGQTVPPTGGRNGWQKVDGPEAHRGCECDRCGKSFKRTDNVWAYLMWDPYVADWETDEMVHRKCIVDELLTG